MTDLKRKVQLGAVLALTGLLTVVGVLNLRDRLSASSVPEDGIRWIDTEEGVRAQTIRPDSPLVFSVRSGDYVRAIKYDGKFERVERAETLPMYLDRLGIGAEATYVIEHPDTALQNIYGLSQPLYDVEFRVPAAAQELELGLYLGLVGLVYLAVGLFVLLKQSRAALTYHFYAWFLASFVAYFYSSTTTFTRVDKFAGFLDRVALALLAPLFLHFCAKFPAGLSKRWALLVRLTYIPAVLVIVFEVLFHYKSTIFRNWSLVEMREFLNVFEARQYALFLAIGSARLVYSFVKARTPGLRQQLKWIIWGLGISALPVATLYLIPNLLHVDLSPAMKALAYGPLIFIPLSFGYSIVRYRLMDVDVIVRRSFVHVVAIAAVGAIYMALLLAVTDLVRFIWPTADLNSMKTKVIIVVGMLVVAMLFAPIKNKLRVWADRWFYGERYTLRMGLQDFGRTLAQTTALPHVLNSLVRRLSEMLSVRRVAIFIEDPESPSSFRLAHSTGLENEAYLPENIKSLIRRKSVGRGFILSSDLNSPLSEAATSPRDEAELYYYVPCVVRDRMVAVIGLGRTASGALLTSEDTELLRALSGYVAVSIENSLLYKSEMEKAEELARLKDFSENIIESVSVGIVVIDLDGRITTWNSAMEEMFGVTRNRALGMSISSVFDLDLIETIRNATGQQGWDLAEARHIYKFNATTEDGRPLTVNMSLAPFEQARGVVTGTLLVIENVTERVQLEQQFLQREKLSSIGLLAAGVAHEVNTPLAGISSYTQMLLQQTGSADPTRQLLEKIHSQTLRASGIVNNLLNFSRTGDTRFQDVDINNVLEDTLQLLEPQLRNSKIEVKRGFGRNLPAAFGSGSKLQQVFMNLVLNARDAMAGGGRLSIQTRLVDTSLVIDFSDTGVGIAPENIARIYDPFFTTKDVGQGTGLGLALSYGIIQEHGGRIFVESRQGEGAHFTIKLPTSSARQMQVASD